MNTENPIFHCKHNNFLSIDAEQSVFQLYALLRSLNADFLPIVDSAENNLVGVLGYLDILYVLAHCAQQFPLVASVTVDQLTTLNLSENLFAPLTTPLHNILTVINERSLSCIPITDDNTGSVVGLFQKSDTSYLSNSPTPEEVMAQYPNLLVGSILQASADMAPNHVITNFCSCMMTTNMKDLLDSMVNFRTTRAVCVDSGRRFLCIVEVKDIVRYFLRC